jgi:hypothetical protein
MYTRGHLVGNELPAGPWLSAGNSIGGANSLGKPGRRGPHGPRPPTLPDVLIVSGDSLCGSNSACVSAGQGSFSVQRCGCLPLLKRSRSSSAFAACARAHALLAGSSYLAVAPHPSSIPVCSLAQKVRPFVGSRRLLWPLLTSLHPSHTVAVAVVWLPQTDVETSQGKSCLFPSVPAGFTSTAFRMATGPPHPLLGYPAVAAFYPVSARRVRVLPSCLATGRFLQTPSHDGRRCFG